MSEQDDREFDALKRDYARLPKHEPGETIDAAIRAAARRNAPRRRLRVWSAALASAACIGLAVVLVPALRVETHAPEDGGAQQRQAELMIRVARDESERRAVEESATQKARERAMPMIAAPAPPASRAPTDSRAENYAPPAAGVVPGLDALRAELADADEATWRRRILELRASDRESLAAALLDDFRTRFDRPASFTLDDLAREDAEDRR